VAGAVWLSLAGFHVVKNAIALDAETGVGQVLAATPLRRALYLAVLASMTAARAGTALLPPGHPGPGPAGGLPPPPRPSPALVAVVAAAFLALTAAGQELRHARR